MFQRPYVTDIFFSFCAHSFDFLTISSKMSSDSSGFQTNNHDSLTGLCRICGERARRKYEKTIPKLCVDYKSDIDGGWILYKHQVYRLNINGDDIDRHPTNICNRCYTVMKKALRTKDVNILDNASQRVTTDYFGHFILNRAAECALTMWHRTKVEGQPRTGG